MTGGLIGGGWMFRVDSTMKWSEGDVAEQLMTGDKVDCADVITRSRVLLLLLS